MKKLVAAAVVVALVLLGWRLWPRSTPSAPPAASTATPHAVAAPAGSAAGKVRRLTREQRKQLGDQIAAAAAKARPAPSAAPTPTGNRPAPALPDLPDIPLEQVAMPVQQAMADAVKLIAECYPDQHAGDRATAMMTMISDPELGTVIDTDAITDHDGKPLDAKLDGCLRDVIDSLALPPLGVAGKLKLQYTLRFDE